MEALFLLCSFLSTILTSLAPSLLLLLRSPLLLLRRGHSFPTLPPPTAVDLYQGTVWHERRRPVHHSFRYPVRYALIHLDTAPHAPPNHLSADQARQIANTTGPVFLLTIPPSVGYEQNPLSLYYCYVLEDSSQVLKSCIAEVTNTPWGERASFVFNPFSDLVAKPLHVSPFMDMLGDWCIRANAPGDNLSVSISVQHPELGNYFSATLTAQRMSPLLVADHALFFWLMPHKVAFWIYWHALKLWWKTVPFIQHPKYLSSPYKAEAIARDQKLQSCPVTGFSGGKHPLVEGSNSEFAANRNGKARWFRWQDAEWPWC